MDEQFLKGNAAITLPPRFSIGAPFSVFGLRLGLLLRIGWVCLIVAVLEDDHLHPLTAERRRFCMAGHVDVDVGACQ
jgi:hypothetical protein